MSYKIILAIVSLAMLCQVAKTQDYFQCYECGYMEDHLGIIEHALTNQNVDGILNSVAPELVDHAEFARLISAQTKRPNWYSPSRLKME